MSIIFKYVAYLYASTLIFKLPSVTSSPVIIPDVAIINPRPPENICHNEPLEEGGYAKLIEDCNTLRRLTTPPEQILRFIGSNIQVCCPEDTFEEPEELVVKDGLGSIEDDQGTVWDFPTEPPKTSV